MSTGSDTSNQRPDCVVIDTNIWRSQYLLNTPTGQSLVYTLGRKGGYIGLPEVVEGELTKEVVEAGLEDVRKLAEQYRRVSLLTDSLPSFSSPTELELKKKVEERIAKLEPILVRVPFTLEHAKAALDMVNAKLPPNGPGSQQFKDSAIWQAVLTLSREYTTYLLTNDHAFLLDRKDPKKGLAPELLDDCRRAGGSVKVYCDLGSCLDAISGDVPSFDRDRLTSLIVESLALSIQAEAMRGGFKIGEILDTKIKAFRTKQSDRVAVDYTIARRFEVDPSVITDGRTDCRAIIRGSCYYDRTADSLNDEFIEDILIESKYSGDGHQTEWRSLGGDPSIPFRRPIDPWREFG